MASRLESEHQNSTWLGLSATTDYGPTIVVDQRLVTLGLVDPYPATAIASWFGHPGRLAQNVKSTLAVACR